MKYVEIPIPVPLSIAFSFDTLKGVKACKMISIAQSWGANIYTGHEWDSKLLATAFLFRFAGIYLKGVQQSCFSPLFNRARVCGSVLREWEALLLKSKTLQINLGRLNSFFHSRCLSCYERVSFQNFFHIPACLGEGIEALDRIHRN